MTQATKNPFFAGANSEAQFESLEPGTYNAVCVGVTLKELPSYNDKNVLEDKVQFVFAVYESGEKFYLRTKPMKLVISEKSNLAAFIMNWTKATLDRIKDGFSCDKMIGFGAQLVVMQHEYNGRYYPDIANVLPLKKGVKVEVVADEIPAYLGMNVKAQAWAPGITVRTPDLSPAGLKQVNAGVYQKDAGMDVQLKSEQKGVDFGTVTPQPAPAPAVPEAEQAPQLDDDGEPLPF